MFDIIKISPINECEVIDCHNKAEISYAEINMKNDVSIYNVCHECFTQQQETDWLYLN